MSEQEQDQDLTGEFKEEILQQFQTADGGTIVLSSEQIAQMQQGMEEQHFVEEIIGDDPNGEDQGGEDHNEEEMETQQIHIDADGNTQIISSDGQMHDLITLHAVDSQGNLISGPNDEEGGSMEEHVEIPMDDQAGIEQMMEADNVVEEVIASGNHDEENFLSGDNMAVSNEMPQQFLNVQEAIFNPQTGTLQPITSVQTPVTNSKPARRPTSKQQSHQQVKYVISQPSADGGQGQQIILDANSLQGLIQGGTLSLDGSSGKNILLQSPSKSKSASSRSPAKILPAPVPVGDQQQHQHGGGVQKIMFKQGNVFTPVSLSGGNQGETRVIQIPGSGGNQVQYVRVISNKTPITPSNKVPIAPATLKPKPVAPKPAPGQTIYTLPAGTTAADIANFQNAQGLGNFVVVPSNYVMKSEQGHHQSVQIRSSESMNSSQAGGSVLTDSNSILGGLSQTAQGQLDSFRSLLEPNGMRPRKPCNCTKSQCLKLYCDCFANGEFCHLCNCTNCYNNLNHEEDRQKAIKLVLERNPGAFRPKIGKSSMTGEAHERRHNKGCNCRRSGCLKNYCECYEAKIFCSGICKCTGCKNCIENIPSGLPNGVGVEQHFAGAGTAHRQTLKDLAEAAEVRVQQQNQVKNKMRAQMQEVSPQNNLGIMVPPLVFRYPHGSISYEVITSTVELLLAKAEAGEKQKLSDGEIERLILDEFSECLASVMDLGSTIE